MITTTRAFAIAGLAFLSLAGQGQAAQNSDVLTYNPKIAADRAREQDMQYRIDLSKNCARGSAETYLRNGIRSRKEITQLIETACIWSLIAGNGFDSKTATALVHEYAVEGVNRAERENN